LTENVHPDPLVPPPHLMFDGTLTVEDFIAHRSGLPERVPDRTCPLRRSERVLDLDSGIGQKARFLTRYLDGKGGYEGLYIVPEYAWCREAYASYPNFNFTLAHDLYSSHYNPNGKIEARHYRLPYNDADFDEVLLASVFTHLIPEETENYIGEIARVLRPGGRCVASAFLLNAETVATSRAKTRSPFRSTTADIASCRTTIRRWLSRSRRSSCATPLRATACEIAYGFWSGAVDVLQAPQDCMIAVRAREDGVTPVPSEPP
jgi:SAM-dependent methyltransferase